MKKTKIFTLTLLTLLICSIAAAFIPKTQAVDTIISMYDGASQVGGMGALHPSASATISSWAMTFTPTSAGYVTEVMFELKKTGMPNGTLSCNIQYTTTGTLAGSPNGTIIETASNTIAMSSLTTSPIYYVFTFSGTELLDLSEVYAITIYNSDATDVDATTNYPIVYGTNSNVIGGYGGNYKSSAWSMYTDEDLSYVVIGTAAPAATPTPTPTPSPAPTVIDGTTFIWDGTKYVHASNIETTIDTYILTDWTIALIIVLICGAFGAWAAGAYGFMAGILIGTIFCYVGGILDLWAIVAVLVVDGLLLFGKMSASKNSSPDAKGG